MADKLDWMNKHLVLLRYIDLEDVVLKEGYKIRPDLAELFVGMTGAEDMVFKFADAERYKCACELMAYIAHRRAAVWWGYRCVCSLIEELKINPAEERDIADIGANLEPEIPDFAKVEPPKASPEDEAKIKEQVAQIDSEYQKMRSAVDPEVMNLVDEAMEVVYKEFESIHGIHPIELMEKLAKKLSEDTYQVDPDSPIFKEVAKLKAKLQAEQKEIVDTIKSVIPPKVPAHQKKLRDNALNAVYSWVAAPNAENSQKCLDVGNECPDTPAGLLSLAAFWAFGDLMPMGEQTVPTPPGLAANGLCQVLLFCAVSQGGTRKLKERYEEYFRIGLEVLTGADNWEKYVAIGKAPHEEENEERKEKREKSKEIREESIEKEEEKKEQITNENATQRAPVYKRWKPEEKEK